jgi:hypothetical protein
MIRARRASPIDQKRGVALLILAKLPEGFARPGAPPSVNAMRDGLRDTACFDQKSWQTLGQCMRGHFEIMAAA